VTYDYLDAVLNPSYGTVGVTDVPQERPSNARWMTKLGTWNGGGVFLDKGRAPFTALVVEGKTKDGETFLANVDEVPSVVVPGATKRLPVTSDLH